MVKKHFMSDREWYQGIPESHAALLYGEISVNAPPRHVQAYFGQEAYEILQLHVYMKELLRVKEDPAYICWSPGFGLLWAAFEVLGAGSGVKWFWKPPKVTLEEMGSTLFSTINKLEKLRAKYGGSADPMAVQYVGIEPSGIFASTAEQTHPNADITHYTDWRDLPSAAPLTLGRSYQATSYAFNDVEELCAWVFRSTCSIHGLWFSLSDEDRVINAHGKRLTLFSLRKFCDQAKDRGFAVLPISSDRYSFGEVEFISAFVLLYRLEGWQLVRFQDYCSRNGNFGVPDFSPAGTHDPVDWIRSRAIPKGSHAGFLEPGQGSASQSWSFDFSSASVQDKFREYLDKLFA